jgi:hypothetical protein
MISVAILALSILSTVSFANELKTPGGELELVALSFITTSKIITYEISTDGKDCMPILVSNYSDDEIKKSLALNSSSMSLSEKTIMENLVLVYEKEVYDSKGGDPKLGCKNSVSKTQVTGYLPRYAFSLPN